MEDMEILTGHMYDKDVQIERLRTALDAGIYLINRYRSMSQGQCVRDLGEAESGFQTALEPLQLPLGVEQSASTTSEK